ncbi:putative ribonuclease H-like domain-containing protein [Tanacetum coccineum]
MIRNKGRLVAQGYTQEKGIEYDEFFALVARIKAIKLFLAYASFKDSVVYQMDVKSAFLYGKIEEEVYVCQPPGFEDSDFPDRVYNVEKALYGLHQAPRAWYKGDILLMSSMGELTFFLGLQVQQKKDGIFISHDKYVAEILKKFRFTEVKTASTPMETQKPLLKDENGKEVDVHMYRSMIGSLMYLTSSRPDIMFAVCACARYQVNPKVSHLHVVKRIFRYLKGQPELGLWYPKDSHFDLVAYTDSDYDGASLDRKSTTGGCQFLRCRLISWQCKKQTVVANSTTEAEQCMTRSSAKELLSPFENPKQKFRSKRRLFDTPSLLESSLLEFDHSFDIKEQSEEGEIETMAETMEQYMSKTRENYGSGVVSPTINQDTPFELKGQFLKELRENTFSGLEHEDANEHIEKVLEIVDLFHIPKVTQDQIMLRAFPLSLTGAASRWLRNQPSRSITTWEEPDESLFRAWENFKELLMKCPQHYLTDMQEVILFYNGLDVPTRQILDSKGAIPSKTAVDVKVAIQEMDEYSQKWQNGTSSRTKSTETSDGLATIQAQLNNLG